MEPVPPLGLMPRWRWIALRIRAIDEAMDRYIAAGERVPTEWIEERIQLQREVYKP